MATTNSNSLTEEQLRAENAELRARLEVAEETLRTIRGGEIDSLVVETEQGPQIFSLDAAEAASNRFRGDILAQVTDAVGMIDNDDRITYLNPAIERLYRVQAGEMLGRKVSELYQRRWLKPGDEAVAMATLREKGEASWELIHLTRDGRELHVQSSVCLMRDVSGKGTGIIASIRDITERKVMEERLREREHFLQRMTDVSPSIIVVFDLQEQRSVYINRSVASVLGYSPEDIIGIGDNVVPILMHPDDSVHFTAHLDRVRLLRGDEIADFEYRLRDPKGEWHWFHSRDAVFARDAAGAVSQLIGTTIEITARKQAEAALRESQLFTRRVLDNLFAFVGVLTPDGTLIEANRAPLEAAGISANEVLGKRFWDCPWWSYSSEVQSQLRAACESAAAGEVVRYDVPVRIASQATLWIDFQLSPLRDTEGRITHLIPSGMDITERRRSEKSLRQNAELFVRLVDQAPTGMYIVDADFQVQQVNSRAAPVFAKVDRLIGRDFTEVNELLWGPEVAAEVERIFRHTLDTGERYVSPSFTHERHDIGGEQAYEWEIQRVSLADGRNGVACYFEDVTERHRAERAIRDSETRLRLATETNAVGIWEWNVFTNAVRWDEQMFRLYGITPTADGSLQYSDWSEAVLPEDLPEIERILMDTVSRSGQSRREFRIRRRNDGEVRDIECAETVRTNEQGQAEWVVGTNLDVTERKRAESALLESRRKLQLGIDVAAFAIAEVDYVAHTIELSPDAARMFGIGDSATTVPRQRIHDLFHPEDRSRIHLAINDCLASEGADQIAIEHRIVLPDGTTRWLDVRKRVHFDNSASSRRPLRSTMVARDVTQEKLLQSELIENRERLTLAMRAARMGAFQWEPDTDIAQWDDQWSAVIGVDKDALKIGKTFLDLVHPDDVASLMAATPKVTETQSEYRAEYRIIRPDGQLRWLAASGMMLPRQNGHVARLVGLNWDITEQKESAERIRQGEERLRLAMNAAQLSLWEWDVVNDQVSWAKELYDRQSMDRMTPVGGFDGFIDMVHIDDRKTVRAAIHKCLSEGEPYHCEFRMRRGDGSYRWVLSMAHLSIDGNNAPVRMVGVEMDITDRKENELSLRLSSERLAVAADAAGFGMLHVDLKLQTVTYSPEMKRIFGWSDDQSVSLKPGELLEFVHPDDRVRCAKHYEKAMLTDSPKSQSIDHRMNRTDGMTRWVRLQTKTLFSEQTGEAVQIVGTVLDITQQRMFEEQLKAARDAAEAANQSKSAFVANMSHEIRTPMTAILGYADLIRDMIENPEVVRHLQTIRRNGAYLLEIINDILDLSKIEAGKLDIEMERFQPVKLIEDVRSVMEVRATEGGLTLEVEYDGRLPKVIESDAKRLKQVLINLVGNAIKFTYRGNVKIRVRYQSEVSVSASGLEEQDFGMLQFDIIDTGIGMTEVQQERLFRPFSQGDASVTRRFGGTGLGLAISQRLAEMLGGAISAISTEGVGSTFTVTVSTGSLKDVELVDYSDELAEQPKQVEPTATEATSLDCHVLIVDDRRDIRFLSRHILSKAGASVDEVEDGLLALDYIRDRLVEGNPPSLILLDMQMPNLDGYETAKQLRASGFVGPIIALTADAMQGDMNRCLEAGCNDYMSKPIDAARLVELAREMIGSVWGPPMNLKTRPN